MASRLVLAGFAAAGLVFAGCQTQPAPPSAQSSSLQPANSAAAQHPGDASPNVSISPGGSSSDTSASRPAASDDPRFNTATLLAHTAENYAKSVGASDKQPGDASKVNWIEPAGSPNGNQRPAEAGRPLPVQVEIASAHPAEIPTVVPAPKDTNVPRIVPEAQDLPASAQPPAPPSTDALAAKLTQQVHDYPRDIASQMDLQMLQFLRDEPVPSMDSLANLPAEDREILSAVMDGLSNFRNTVRSDRNLLVSKKVQPLLDMADRLRAQADLTIPTLTLCRKVSGFGNYDPMDSSFDAGTEHPAILYCEIQNFASTLDDKKMWQTRLSQEAVLYTETGLKVWGDSTPAFTDYSRNRRHDFYLVKKITLPANLTIGRYLLKVSIVDQQANRVSEATMPVSIVAQ